MRRSSIDRMFLIWTVLMYIFYFYGQINGFLLIPNAVLLDYRILYNFYSPLKLGQDNSLRYSTKHNIHYFSYNLRDVETRCIASLHRPNRVKISTLITIDLIPP